MRKPLAPASARCRALAAPLLLALLLAPGAVRAQEPPSGATTPDTPPAQADARPRRRGLRLPPIGPELNLYRFQSASAATRFGAQARGLSFGWGKLEQSEPRLHPSSEVELFWADRDQNELTLFPVAMGARYAVRAGRGLTLYGGAEGAFMIAQMRAEAEGIRDGYRSAGGYGVHFGAHFGPRAFAQVRYVKTGSIRGIDLSGIAYTAGLRF